MQFKTKSFEFRQPKCFEYVIKSLQHVKQRHIQFNDKINQTKCSEKSWEGNSEGKQECIG